MRAYYWCCQKRLVLLIHVPAVLIVKSAILSCIFWSSGPNLGTFRVRYVDTAFILTQKRPYFLRKNSVDMFAPWTPEKLRSISHVVCKNASLLN